MSGPNGEGPLAQTQDRPTLPDPSEAGARLAARKEIEQYMVDLCHADPPAALDLVVRLSQILRDNTIRP